MERSFAKEIAQLQLGNGQLFQGEGILAVTKALLQSGVSYVGGYQGAPVSHLLDVMVQARDWLDTLGVHVEPCTNEASAAAMLGASIAYPVRGAVTWKSIVGTNVAADALSNLASAGVLGGTLIVVGEDYGEGASVIQERTHAFAMKSSMWLLDPRPDLPTIVRMVEHGFELSEASSTPVMMGLRIRACHVRGAFVARDNLAPAVSTRHRLAEPAAFSYDRLSHPPSTFAHEKLKHEVRMPAARRYVVDAQLNERIDGDLSELGIIVQGGLTPGVLRALQTFGLADGYGASRVPMLVLNVVYPLVPEQLAEFCRHRRAVLVIEEGQPDYIEQEIAAHLRRAGVDCALHGKDWLPMSGELSVEAMLPGLTRFVERYVDARPDGGAPADAPIGLAQAGRDRLARLAAQRSAAAARLADPLPARPPGFCVGCPERPVFAALKLVREQTGPMHVSTDIGCHSFATFAPFSLGNSILGYGMSLASAAGVAPLSARRPVAIMGDGGFWHNGLLSGVASSLMNRNDGVLVVMKNGYTSATGTQETISTPDEAVRHAAGGASATGSQTTIEQTLRGMGVQHLTTVHTYRVAQMKSALHEALTTDAPGLKVIIAEGECQLERQRRVKPQRAAQMARGERVVRTRYGVDEDVCTGDHACIRLSGCPSLSVRDPSDPLKVDPVAQVDQDCVGCGLCGENAHAATLCPSFWSAEIVHNPGRAERIRHRLAERLLRLLSRRRHAPPAQATTA